MIQERAVQALYKRVGWKQPTIVDYANVDSDNIASTSGKFFQDFNSLVTIKNIKDTQENPNITDKQFNAYLKDMQLKAIRFVLEAVFENRVYESKTLMNSENGNDETYTLDSGNFYGIEIDLMKSKNIAMRLKQVGLYFDADNDTPFKLYLFHSSKKEFIKEWDVTTVDKTETFTNINETIYAFSESIKGGKYYLGFRASDVVGSPIRRSEWIKQSCFVDLSFIRVPMASLELFNIDDVVHVSEEYLNVDYSTEKDSTEFIISNSGNFDTAIGLQNVANVLELIINSTRSNNTERNLKAMKVEAFLELNGNDINPNIPFKVGLISKLAKEISSLKSQFNKRSMASVGTLTV